MCWCSALILSRAPRWSNSLIWVASVAVFLMVVVVIRLLAHYAPDMKLLAVPGKHRQHEVPTPMVGGIGIYVGLLLGLFLIGASYLQLMPSLLLLCIAGALDDRYSLPSWSRFLVQGLAVYLMIELTGVQLASLGFLVTSDTEVLVGKWSVALTIFASIGVINAVNMSDGLDGLAGSMLCIVLLTLIVLKAPQSELAFVGLLSIAGFLFWNLRVLRSRAVVFMGDAGSTMLGLLIAYLLIDFSQTAQAIAPVTALWILALPLMDAVAVLIVRPLVGRSPFAADRIHYHHQLADKGLSVNTVIAVSLGAQIILIMIGIGLWGLKIAENIQLALFLGLFSFYFYRLLKYARLER